MNEGDEFDYGSGMTTVDFGDAYEVQEVVLRSEDAEVIAGEKMTMDNSEPAIEKIDFRGGHGAPPPQLTTGFGERKAKDGMSHNTGAKGVKADYAEAKFNMQKNMYRVQQRKNRNVERMARGDDTRQLQEIASDASEITRAKLAQKFGQMDLLDKSSRSNGFYSDSEESSELSDDEAIFNSYKLKQLELIKNSIPQFGMYNRVDKNEMAKNNNSAHELVYVVTHIYENHIPACVKLNLVFEHLCQVFPHVLFMRIRAADAGQSTAGLPLLLIYKGGKMLHGLTKIDNKLPQRVVNDENVVKYLSSMGILKSNTMALEEKMKATLRQERRDVERDYDH